MRWAIWFTSSCCQDSALTLLASSLSLRGSILVPCSGMSVRQQLHHRSPQHTRRAQPLKIDEEMYKWRHLIENFFCKLKEFKRIAMRCDKTDQSFAAMIYLAAAVINSR